MTYQKPLPAPDPETKPFWDAARDHRLVIQRCKSTGKFQFPPTTFCPGSHLERPEWVEASGRGTVFSWIVVRHPVPKDLYQDEVPYIVGLIALDEGCRMTGNIVGCAPEAVTPGMKVAVEFRDVTPEISLPVFRPVAS